MKKQTDQKEYIVIGMGRFGSSVAKQLEANGCKVLAVDCNEDRIRKVSEYVTMAICADITKEDSLEELGMNCFDGAVVSMGHSLEAAIFAVIWAKEQGVPRVIAKAYDEMQGKILAKVGADEVVYPEREMGRNLANNLALNHLLNTVNLTADYTIADLPVPKSWIGRSLRQLQMRETFQVNVIALRRDGALELMPNADVPLSQRDMLVLLGSNETIQALASEN